MPSPTYLPFDPSDNNFTVYVPFDDEVFAFRVYWNERDSAWYLDMAEEDEAPIISGMKVTLGTNLGRKSSHSFFRTRALRAIDTTGKGSDASYDDLGGRVLIQVIDLSDYVEL